MLMCYLWFNVGSVKTRNIHFLTILYHLKIFSSLKDFPHIPFLFSFSIQTKILHATRAFRSYLEASLETIPHEDEMCLKDNVTIQDSSFLLTLSYLF